MTEPSGPFTHGAPVPSDRRTSGRTPLWLFHPDSPPIGAVLFLHHRTGCDEFTADITARLLGLRFAVAVPNLFAGQPAGLAPEERKGLLADDELLPVMSDAVAALPDTGLGVAALGFCMGGRLAFLAATAGVGVSRACCFYGGSIDQGWQTPLSPLDRVRPGVPPVQMHRGTMDTNPQAAHVDAAVSAFDVVGGSLQACTYTGVGHAFANPGAIGRHHPAMAVRAWATASAFLMAAGAGPALAGQPAVTHGKMPANGAPR